MSPPKNITVSAIINYLTTHCKTKSHIHQIQTHLIINKKLLSNSTIAQHFITICQSLNLLTSNALPLYINNNQIKNKPQTFTCNTLLKAFSYSRYPDNENSWLVYSYMHKNSVLFNNYTFPFVLKAFSDLGFVKDGILVHAQIVKGGFLDDVYVGNSLLNLYGSRNGDTCMCMKVFDEMPVRDVVSWTTLVSGFKEARRFEEALVAFERMRGEGVVFNRVTAVCVLDACACIGALDMGVWIHEHVMRSGWELDVVLGTSLVDLYGKCGRMDEALRVFGEMSVKNVFTWNAVISGLSVSQSGERAIEWFNRMEEEGVKPDEVTLVSVLSACVHSGNLHMGRRIFSSLSSGKFGFLPSGKHYACMIDLLSRSRCLDEAFRMINEMLIEPTVSICGSFLAGCRAQANNEMSEVAAWKLVELEQQNSAHYVVLSNMYAEMGKWSDVEKVRKLMKERGLKKDMGSSGVELEGQEHESVLLA